MHKLLLKMAPIFLKHFFQPLTKVFHRWCLTRQQDPTFWKVVYQCRIAFLEGAASLLPYFNRNFL